MDDVKDAKMMPFRGILESSLVTILICTPQPFYLITQAVNPANIKKQKFAKDTPWWIIKRAKKLRKQKLSW